DGRIILVAADGGQPGFSIGLSTFELAQAMARLGAVTAGAVDSGSSVSLAFDGTLLDRPAVPDGAPVKEALVVQYFGVYAPDPPLPLVNGTPTRSSEALSYKLVRPSTVTAQLVGPDTVTHVLESGVQHEPGTYTFPTSSFDAEGTWRWEVSATDDLGRTSTIERTFRYDRTLESVVAPKGASGTAALAITLARPAKVAVRMKTTGGRVVATLPARQLPTGTPSVQWDGLRSTNTRAPTGGYVAQAFATSEVGTSDLSTSFAFRRVPA